MISVLYDGGGTTNALQAAVDLDAVIALATQPTAIATGNNTGIELFMSVAADDKSPVVVSINHTAAAISLSTIVHIQEDTVSAADMAFKVDRSIWGLAATTDHEPKRLVYFPCAPDSYVSIVCQSLDGSAVYCKYRLTQMHTAAAGGAGATEGGGATEANQDIIRAVDEGRAIAASGQHLDNAGGGTAASTNYTVTVVASAIYRVHAVNGVMYLGIADATSDANVIWIVGAGNTEIITIPSGTSLTYAVDTAGVEGRLARIK